MKLLFTILTILITFNSFSQYFTIKGRVLDNNGNPLEYTTIKSKRLKDHFLTNKVGFFSFKTPYTFDTLICKHANFEEKLEVIYNNDTVTFILLPKQILYTEKLNVEKQNNFSEDSSLIKKWFDDKYQEEMQTLCNRRIPSIVLSPVYSNKYFDNTIFINDFKLAFNNKKFNPFIGFIKLGLKLDKEGKVISISIIKGINRVVDNQVVEIVQSLSKFKPAVQNGITLASYIEIDIHSY